MRPKQQPKPQQIHYCEVCKISCAGPQTYREHLEGQKHKRREASLKMAATAVTTTQNRGNNLHCELCDVTCTGSDAYAAHVRGSKHQKVVKLHQKLGKPIPVVDPNLKKASKITFVAAGTDSSASTTAANATSDAAANNVSTVSGVVSGGTGAVASTAVTSAEAVSAAAAKAGEPMDEDCGAAEDEIKPVGNEYIEEIKDEDGKMIKFNCKLCECGFNDPNAKEMHMKGRRHRLQYKRKVQPDLVVDFKPTPRQRRIAEAKAQRAVMQAEYWNRQRNLGGDDSAEDPMYWDERRRFDNEFDCSMGWNRGFGGPRGHHVRGPPPPYFGMMQGRNRPESFDDRHVVARHAEIYPKEEELQVIQRIVSHTERALKFVSDVLTEKTLTTNSNGKENEPSKDVSSKPTEENANAIAAPTAEKDAKPKEDGRDNQMFSFQKEAEAGAVRLLKGVMRVGLLAKGKLTNAAPSSIEINLILDIWWQVFYFKVINRFNWWYCAPRNQRLLYWNAYRWNCQRNWKRSPKSISTPYRWRSKKVRSS